MWTRYELKIRAKEVFKGDYWNYVLVTLLLGLLMGSSILSLEIETNIYDYSTYYQLHFFGLILFKFTGKIVIVIFIILLLLRIFFVNVIQVGGCKFFINGSLEKGKIEDLFFGFQKNYKNILYVQFMTQLKIFLWSLLFIIPGIIKSYEYAMVPYLLADNSDMDKDEILNLSRRMIEGNKWDFFVLELSFIGWILLAVSTFNIVGILYVDPYIEATHAQFYLKIKSLNNKVMNENVI